MCESQSIVELQESEAIDTVGSGAVVHGGEARVEMGLTEEHIFNSIFNAIK